MAAAQILRLTHSVEDKVKVVDNKVTGVGNTMKVMDDKMDILLTGTPDSLATQCPILIVQNTGQTEGMRKRS